MREVVVLKAVTMLELPAESPLDVTWRGRRIILRPVESSSDAVCYYCGRSSSQHLYVRVEGGDERLICPSEKVYIDPMGRVFTKPPGEVVDEFTAEVRE